MKIRQIQSISAVLRILLLIGMLISIPAPMFAQTVGETDLPVKIYLPVVTDGGEVTSQLQANESIPGQYIVVFQDDLVSAAGVHATAAELATTLGGELLHTYDAALNGFAVKLPTAVITAALTTLQNDARVSYVEPDQMIFLDPIDIADALTNTIAMDMGAEAVSAATVDGADTTQTNPVWNLDRIDQRNLPLNNQYIYNSTGSGVRVYIIDSGIRISHSEFQGRASYGTDLVDGSLPADDCNGHGTHVAGTVGGRTYGVAKGVQLIAVRIFDCSGGSPRSRTIAAVNWVTSQRQANPKTLMVVNMSIGGPILTGSLDTAVQNSINAGITYAIAAGNDNIDACTQSPAHVAAAITVGATAANDGRVNFSNFGSCLDLFAPGVSVLSASHINDTATRLYSGTSMAAPHVAGVAALYLQSNPAATPAQVANAIINNAITNVVSTPGTGSPNRLLFSLIGSAPTTPCFPEYPTLNAILGTPGNDPALNGTAAADRICGFTGNDVLYGNAGNDVLAGNEGQDTLYGGPGNDNVGGGKDNDTVSGDDGNDTVVGGQGDDTVYGNKGSDTVYGGEGNDIVGGGEDDDTIYGETGNDQLYGGKGNDNLWGGAGSDVFHYTNGQGNDTIRDFDWSADSIRLYEVTLRNTTQLGTDCQLNLSPGATIRLSNVGTCRTPTIAMQ